MEYNREVMIILFDYLTLSSMIIFIHLFKLSSMISSKNHCHLNISFSSLIKKVENLKSVDIRCTEGRNVIVPIRCCANCICICVFFLYCPFHQESFISILTTKVSQVFVI